MVFGFLLAAAAVGLVNTGCGWVHKFAVRKRQEKAVTAVVVAEKVELQFLELRLLVSPEELQQLQKGDINSLGRAYQRFEKIEPQLERCSRCKKPVTNLAAYLGGTS